jgi:hypothetical protein
MHQFIFMEKNSKDVNKKVKNVPVLGAPIAVKKLFLFKFKEIFSLHFFPNVLNLCGELEEI